MSEEKCPMKLTKKGALDIYCEKEKCAWWIPNATPILVELPPQGCCAIKSIAISQMIQVLKK